MQAAPLFDDIAAGPPGGAAHWLTTTDGVRIRVAHWAVDGAKGSVLIFPGRTEFIEKYGMAAKELRARGYASLAIDWRGQGLADRLADNRAIGHVGAFADYQTDIDAVMAYATKQNMPRPYFLLAHSMGGCIGLRGLTNGLEVRAAVFSAPMWGIAMTPALRAVAWALSTLSIKLGFDQKMTPGQHEKGYVLREDFAVNTLTNDAEIWDWLSRQLQAHPELSLGGPSLRWMNMALREMRALSMVTTPNTPCLTYVGSMEKIVVPQSIHTRMDAWPNGTLRVIDGGKHEMLMDRPDLRNTIYDETAAFFDSNLG